MKSVLHNPRIQPSRSHSEAWDGRVAREVEHQTRIEAAFDRADACGRAGRAEQALAWLAQAEALSGELPPAYRAARARLSSELAGQRVRALSG